MDKIDRILNKMNNKNKIKTSQLLSAENDYKLIGQNRKINQLKQESKNDFWTKIKGIMILIYVIIGTIATTAISIAGGIAFFSHTYIFALAMITIQLGLFLLTIAETTIKTKFPDHYIFLKLLQLGLLILSIRFNYAFFVTSKAFEIFTLILCICFDLTILKSISISTDFRQLNFHKKNDLNFNDMGLFKMILFNFTAKLRINTMRNFNYNKAQFEKVKVENQGINESSQLPLERDSDVLQEMEGLKQLDTENEQESKLLLMNDYKLKNNENSVNTGTKKALESINAVTEKDSETLLTAILENKSNDNISPSIKELEELTGFSRNKISDIKKVLTNEGILTTKGTKTLVNIDSLNQLQ